MRILSLPDDVMIGGLDAQAERLSLDAALAAEAAEALVRSVRSGDSTWRQRTPAREEETTWLRSATGW